MPNWLTRHKRIEPPRRAIELAAERYQPHRNHGCQNRKAKSPRPTSTNHVNRAWKEVNVTFIGIKYPLHYEARFVQSAGIFLNRVGILAAIESMQGMSILKSRNIVM